MSKTSCPPAGGPGEEFTEVPGFREPKSKGDFRNLPGVLLDVDAVVHLVDTQDLGVSPVGG